MDPRLRADETLARARSRGAFVVTPDTATSPMDASTTVRIPRPVEDPDNSRQDTPAHGWAAVNPDIPPNPYEAHRNPNEFGPLGSQAANQYPQS